MSSIKPRDLLERMSVVAWDFDGVVKDSVTVKSDGFERLFLPYGTDLAKRVRAHHEANGGMSRYEKMPLYLKWAGEGPSPERVRDFCDRFSALVIQAVIDAPWVPGVRKYLETNRSRQRFLLVTATPYEEIQQILESLGISEYFAEVHGAPTPKATAIAGALRRSDCPQEKFLLVGDSGSDLKAAEANDVQFLLRRTEFNRSLRDTYGGPTFDDLRDE